MSLDTSPSTGAPDAINGRNQGVGGERTGDVDVDVMLAMFVVFSQVARCDLVSEDKK